MTLPLLPNARQQFFGTDGKPLSGGKVYTYAAGTSTPKATYTDAAGTVPNTNPIILNSRGEATVFWDGSYKITVTDKFDATIYTQDNVTTPDLNLRSNLNAVTGAGQIGWSNTPSGAVTRTADSKLDEIVSVCDFGASVASSDNTAAIQAALTWVFGADNRVLTFPLTEFACTGSISVQVSTARRNTVIEGGGARIKWPTSSSYGLTIEATAGGTIRAMTIRNLEFQGGKDQLYIKAASLTNTFVFAMRLDNIKCYSFLGNGITLEGNVYEYTLSNFDISSTSLTVGNVITASASAGVLTVTASAANTIAVGDTVGGIPGARIVSFGTGTGGIGTYNISRTATAGSQTMVTSPVGYGIHIMNGTGTGISSSCFVMGGSTRGGVHGLCHESPSNEIRVMDGTYLLALREGVISDGSTGSTFIGFHVENNWVSAGSVANGRAGLRVDGAATIIGIRGECNGVNGYQQYTVQATPTAGGITIIGGQKALGVSGKFGRYSKTSTGSLTLIGPNPNDYDVITGSFRVTTIDNGMSPIQIGYVENLINYAASVTPDLSLGASVRVGALTGNITINNPTNRFVAGTGSDYVTELIITLQQDATGARTVTWGSDFATGMTAIDATASKYSMWTFRWINSKWRQVAFAATA